MDGEKPNTSEDFTFEVQLHWCIRFLEDKLNSQTLNQKEGQSILQSLKILRNEKSPYIKKRRAMHLACGDYRKLMKEENESLAQKMRNNKIVHVKTSTNSHMFKARKSASASKNKLQEKSDKTPFQFNFPVSDKEL